MVDKFYINVTELSKQYSTQLSKKDCCSQIYDFPNCLVNCWIPIQILRIRSSTSFLTVFWRFYCNLFPITDFPSFLWSPFLELESFDEKVSDHSSHDDDHQEPKLDRNTDLEWDQWRYVKDYNFGEKMKIFLLKKHGYRFPILGRAVSCHMIHIVIYVIFLRFNLLQLCHSKLATNRKLHYKQKKALKFQLLIFWPLLMFFKSLWYLSVQVSLGKNLAPELTQNIWNGGGINTFLCH